MRQINWWLLWKSECNYMSMNNILVILHRLLVIFIFHSESVKETPPWSRLSFHPGLMGNQAQRCPVHFLNKCLLKTFQLGNSSYDVHAHVTPETHTQQREPYYFFLCHLRSPDDWDLGLGPLHSMPVWWVNLNWLNLKHLLSPPDVFFLDWENTPFGQGWQRWQRLPASEEPPLEALTPTSCRSSWKTSEGTSWDGLWGAGNGLLFKARFNWFSGWFLPLNLAGPCNHNRTWCERIQVLRNLLVSSLHNLDEWLVSSKHILQVVLLLNQERPAECLPGFIRKKSGTQGPGGYIYWVALYFYFPGSAPGGFTPFLPETLFILETQTWSLSNKQCVCGNRTVIAKTPLRCLKDGLRFSKV